MTIKTEDLVKLLDDNMVVADAIEVVHGSWHTTLEILSEMNARINSMERTIQLLMYKNGVSNARR